MVSATCTADAKNKNTSLVHGAGRAEKSRDGSAYPNVTGIRSLVTQCKISPSVVLPQKTSDKRVFWSLSLVFGVLFTRSKFSRRLVQTFTGDRRVFSSSSPVKRIHLTCSEFSRRLAQPLTGRAPTSASSTERMLLFRPRRLDGIKQ